MLPEVPIAGEAGMPGFDVRSMFGILAPAAKVIRAPRSGRIERRRACFVSPAGVNPD